eukprot:439831-Amorphochlora_amoeboformis.AAC.1
MGILDRRSYHPVEPVSIRCYPSVPGSNGLSCTMTSRDVAPYHGDVTACHAYVTHQYPLRL